MSKRETICVPTGEIIRQKEFIHQLKELNTNQLKKYHLSTFGCQMNENDSEKLAGMLCEMGYVRSDKAEGSNLIVYNTCCVRENAEYKVYGHLGALKKLKQENPGLIIAVCGCMMQQKEVVDHIRKKYRQVDLIFGTHNLHRFPELLYGAVNSAEVIVEVSESDGLLAEGIPIERSDGVKAFVTIMYGCNNFCSYCIVPYVRGRERSRDMEDIAREIEDLGQQGYKEITLLGQNVNSYGKDLEGEVDFAALLHRLNGIPGIERLRFMTSHPKDLSDRLIDAMKKLDRVCGHLHLPIQAGSSRILQEMNRKYTKDHYLGLVEKVRKEIPGISLTTDIIVGFPGETEEDFQETLDVIEKVRYDQAYTFLYSKRTGTPAAKNSEQVAEEVKKERFERLLQLQNRISREINDTLLGTVQEVLVEGLSKTSINKYTGRTGSNKIVNFSGSREIIGSLVKVQIEKVQTWSLEGTIISDEK